MKKKIGIISVLLVVVIVIISTIVITNKIRNNQVNTEGIIAYMYQSDDGEYFQGNSTKWIEDGYILDVDQSKCNNAENSKLDWDANSNEVLLIANKRTNCTLYFDKISDQEKFFQNLLGKSGDGSLLYHNSLLTNGAEDNGYRYSGNNPNNFICFGPGSENYSSSGTCPVENLYRIIGYVPVELSDSTKTKLIKVIKSEYATHEDLEKDNKDGTVDYDLNYTKLKRVNIAENSEAFYWDEDYDNTWGNSSLYQALNNNDKSFLHNLNNWSDKIEMVQWNVEGHDTSELTARAMHNIENDKQQGAKTQVPARIGLIYPSDYGFASEPKSWEYKLCNYDNSKNDEQNENNRNRENNWLFNGVYEWTISRDSSYEDVAFGVKGQGDVDSSNDVGCSSGVRPVFYLNSNVTLSGDNGIDGSSGHPYKVR